MSEAASHLLDQDITALHGLSVKRKTLFAKMDIHSCADLLHFFPRAYEDWTGARPIAGFQAGEEVTFTAVVARQPALFRKGRLTTLRTVLRDESGDIPAVWFNQAYLESKLIKGETFLFRGKTKAGRRGLEIHNPAIEAPYNAGDEQETRSFLKAIYPLTAGLTQGVVRNLIGQLLDRLAGELPEALPAALRKDYQLATAAFSYEQIHRPENSGNHEVARKRLAFEELFMMQLGLKLLRRQEKEGTRAHSLALNRERLETYLSVIKALPYELTRAQQRVLNEIALDLAKTSAMNRLVQGDVGSGKTVVAALAMLQAVMCGKQAAFLAPTSVLAHQHFETISSQLAQSGARVEILTGQQSSAEKKRIRAALAAGEIDILVGTHALLEKTVEFKDLALVITDEQHRFGVKQRLALASHQVQQAHALVMSATPIPRSLGLIIYGDLDISTLDERPAGRQPIATYTAGTADEGRIHQLINKRIDAGEQVYVICPLVKDSEQVLTLESVEKTYQDYRDVYFPERRVGLLHGSLKEKEKNAVMDEFYAGQIDILVSTTVVEVGVDNPNATLMLIKNAERFGLAQLHQLRGRIGRGTRASVCILQSDVAEGLAKVRLTTLCRTDDGFVIAEEDLKLRGPGDFFGTRQHGIPELRIANLYEDSELLRQSQSAVVKILAADPQLRANEHRMLLPVLNRYFGHALAQVGL